MSFAKIKAHFGVEVLVQDSLGAVLRVKVGRNSGHVVGDSVEIHDQRLTRLERKNELIRKTNFGNQVLAANLDYVGIVLSVTPKTPVFFVEQAIMACRSQQIDAFIVITKTDLSDSLEFVALIKSRFGISVPVIVGLAELELFLKQKARFIFIGVSGAGKSTLMNHLVPDAEQKTGTLSNDQKTGRHTTSGSILFDLPGGGELIDSPGVRDFTPVEINKSDVAHFFPGFESWLETPCKFRDCLHHSEPGCLVREQANPDIYQRYLEFCSSL